MICHTIAFVLVVSFQCTPIAYVWDTALSGKCINSQAFVYTAAGVGIVEDFVIMFLPASQLRALELDSRKKFVLGFIFALGSL